jgi:WD40 repeat protein
MKQIVKSMRSRPLAVFLLLTALCWNVSAQSRGGSNETGAVEVAGGTAQEVAVYPQVVIPNILKAAFSPNGKLVLTGSFEGTVKLLDAVTGRLIWTFSVPGEAWSVAISPDSTQLLSSYIVNRDKWYTKLWDAATGREIRTFPGRYAISPDGKQVLGGDDDGNVKLLDIASGREIRTFPKGYAEFSPDGKQILCDAYDGIVKLWDIANGREIRTFPGRYAGFSPDSKQITTTTDGIVKLWDTASGREIMTFPKAGRYAKFSPDGKQILCDDDDGTVKLLDIASGREIRTFPGRNAKFSPDGKQVLYFDDEDNCSKLLAVASGHEIMTFSGWPEDFNSDGTRILSYFGDHSYVNLWDTASGREIKLFSGNTKEITSVTFSPCGRYFLSNSIYGTAESGASTVTLWDAAGGRAIRTFSGRFGERYYTIFSPDGTQFLLSDENGYLEYTDGYGYERYYPAENVKLYDVASGSEIRAFSGRVAFFSPDGKQVLCDDDDGDVKLWDIASGREIRTFPKAESYVSFSPDGKQIITTTANTVKLWDIASGREIRVYSGNTKVVSASFSPDGKYILSRHEDGTIVLWEAHTGKEIKTFSLHTKAGHASFSSDGKKILFLDDEFDNENEENYFSSIKLWDIASGREIMAFSGRYAEFSPDGKQILLFEDEGDYYYSIKLLDIASGREIMSFTSLSNSLDYYEFSPDGKQVLFRGFYFGDHYYSIKLWDIASGREIMSFPGYLASFSPDSTQAISASDGTIRLWDVSTGKETARYIGFTDGEWIVLTPDGYYNSSPNGGKYLNVRVGSSVYGIDQYRATFYNPLIVEARLQGRPDPVLITTTIQSAASYVPPAVVIRTPKRGTDLPFSYAELEVTVVDYNQPVRSIKVLVNGRLVGGESLRGISGIRGGDYILDVTQIRLTANQNRVEFSLSVTLDPGLNRIEVLANNPYSEGRDTVDVNYRQTAGHQNTLPNLWILSIGVNRYDSPRLRDLDYAVNDAREIINAFKTQEGKRYAKINSLLISDGAPVTPTKDNIINNFSRYFRQAGPNDVIMLFIAGHGVNDEDGSFYFMPSDAAFDPDGSILPSKAISYRDIQSVLDRPGQKLVFIDACHSAGTSSNLTRRMNNDRMVNDLNSNPSIRSSSVIFTSSRGDQSSLEYKTYEHGVFTYAILQGLKGEADLMKKGEITMTALELYIKYKIPELTGGQQNPTASKPDSYDDFVVANLK